jgi:hypothetical protein
MTRAPSSGLGSTLGTGTPHSSRRSITSDYDTSSILDSASMYGGDEPSTPSPPIRSQTQQQQQQQQPYREVYVGDELPPRSNSTRKKSKESSPSPSTALPTIITTKAQNNSPPSRSTEYSRSSSVTGDDIEAAFDAINDYKASTNESSMNKMKEHDMTSPDSLFGLSTIKEATDTDEFILGSSSAKQRNDEEIDEIDFDNCFNKYKPQNQTKTKEEVKTPKKSAPSTPVIQQSQKNQEPKSTRHSKEQKRTAPIQTDDIHTPTASIPTPKMDTTPTPTVPVVSTTKQNETSSHHLDDSNDSIDEDVDELLGKLEVSIVLTLIHAHIHTHTYTRKSPLLLLRANRLFPFLKIPVVKQSFVRIIYILHVDLHVNTHKNACLCVAICIYVCVCVCVYYSH